MKGERSIAAHSRVTKSQNIVLSPTPDQVNPEVDRAGGYLGWIGKIAVTIGVRRDTEQKADPMRDLLDNRQKTL